MITSICIRGVVHTKLNDKLPLQRFGAIVRIRTDPYAHQSVLLPNYHTRSATYSAKQMVYPSCLYPMRKTTYGRERSVKDQINPHGRHPSVMYHLIKVRSTSRLSLNTSALPIVDLDALLVFRRAENGATSRPFCGVAKCQGPWRVE
jgi:hypothetical protein